MKLQPQETAQLCRGLSLLLHGGISLADGVYLLAEEASGPMQALLQALGNQMDQGKQLSEAMEDSGAFSEDVSGMVRVGEETGRVEEALKALADYYDERSRTARQIRNAVAYPGMILLLMLAVISVLLIKVLPVFDQVYASLGSRLTGVAAGLLHLGGMLEKALPAILVLLAVLAGLAVLYARAASFREKLNGWYLARFGDRGIARKFHNARFARAMAMAFGSGLPLEDALALAKRLLSGVPGAAARCETCMALLKDGESLAEAMGKTGLLPPAQSRMLSLGLRGGNGDRVMEDIADRMMEEARNALEDAVSRVEPAMVLVSSLLVGLILLAVMLPLMNIMSTIG